MAEPDLDPIRHAVLALHKHLVEAEREAHERVVGRVDAAAFWHLLVGDPAYAWLGPLTAAIVAIDEWLDDVERTAAAAEALIADLRGLLAPDEAGSPFQRRYGELLQARPEIVLAHAATIRALGR